MNRRSFIAACLGAAAGLAAKPALGLVPVPRPEPAWSVHKDVDPVLWLRFIHYSAHYHRVPKLPPIRPGFYRKLIMLGPWRLSDDGKTESIQIDIIDEEKWRT